VKRWLFAVALLAVWLAGCQPKVVEVTRIVEKACPRLFLLQVVQEGEIPLGAELAVVTQDGVTHSFLLDRGNFVVTFTTEITLIKNRGFARSNARAEGEVIKAANGDVTVHLAWWQLPNQSLPPSPTAAPATTVTPL